MLNPVAAWRAGGGGGAKAGNCGNTRDDGAEKLASGDGDGGKLLRCMEILFFFLLSQVKFCVDATTDDTDIVEDILRPRVDSIRGQIKKVILS